MEAFTCLLIFKNIFSFGLTFGAYGWVIDGGIEKMFNVVGSVQVVICLLSIPLCKAFFPAPLFHSLLLRLSACPKVHTKNPSLPTASRLLYAKAPRD